MAFATDKKVKSVFEVWARVERCDCQRHFLRRSEAIRDRGFV